MSTIPQVAIKTTFLDWRTRTNDIIDLVNITKIGTPSKVQTLRDIFNYMESAGVYSGCSISDNGNGTVDVALGEALLRLDANEGSELFSVAVAAQSAVTLTDNDLNYIYVDYNSGTPLVSSTINSAAINNNNICLIGIVSREGISLTILEATSETPDQYNKLSNMLIDTEGYKHVTGGSVLSESGTNTRKILLTSGSFYRGLNKISHNAYDTNTSDTFEYYYRDGIGGWTELTASIVSNIQYDDGSGTLSSIAVDKFAVSWIYLKLGTNKDEMFVFYGQGEYDTIAGAQKESAPTGLPAQLDSLGVLVGRVIIERDATGFDITESAFGDILTAAQSLSHNDASGLQGGVQDEYFHLTSSQHSVHVAHMTDTSNPHSVTQTQVGLSNLSNDAQLKIASNLSDVASVPTSRTNLGLGSIATEVATNVSRYVMKTAQGGTVTEDGADTWAKLATFNLPSANGTLTVRLSIQGSGSVDAMLCDINVKLRNNGTDIEQAACLVEVISLTRSLTLSQSSFKIVAADSLNANIELWINKATTFGTFSVYELSVGSDSSHTITYNNNAAWQSATPSGVIDIDSVAAPLISAGIDDSATTTQLTLTDTDVTVTNDLYVNGVTINGNTTDSAHLSNAGTVSSLGLGSRLTGNRALFAYDRSSGVLTYSEGTFGSEVTYLTIDGSGNVTLEGTVKINSAAISIIDSSLASYYVGEDTSSGGEIRYNGATNKLEIATGTSGYGSQTTRMTFNRDDGNVNFSGNIGLSIDPKTWLSSIAAINIGGNATLAADNTASVNNSFYQSQNAYRASDGNWKFISGIDDASQIILNNGGMTVNVSNGTGVADSVISWTEALSIDNAGSLSINSVNISGGSVTGITDLLVADGGTGVSTLAANGMLVGDGSGSIHVTGVGVIGQVMTSNGTGIKPTFQNPDQTIDGLTSSQFVRSDIANTVVGLLTFTAIPAFNGGATGSSAPFTVDSTFKVTNLNADLLDGQTGAYYEPSFTKNSAFNKNFGTSGTTIAYGNHLHSGVYEPSFTKNSAFNDNYGSAAATVCVGNDSRLSDARTPLSHTHHTFDYASTALAAGATVISDLDVLNGIVTNLTTREMNLGNLGYTGETNATADQSDTEIRDALDNISAQTNTASSLAIGGTFSTTGNVGIGIAPTGNKLHLLGSAGTPDINITIQSYAEGLSEASIALLSRDVSNVNQTVNITNKSGTLDIDSDTTFGGDVSVINSVTGGTPDINITIQSYAEGLSEASIALLSRDVSNVNQTVNITNKAGTLDIDSDATFGGDVSVINSVTGVGKIHVEGFANEGLPYSRIDFYNNDASASGPNIASSIKALAAQANGAGGSLAFSASAGDEAEGFESTEICRVTSDGLTFNGESAASNALDDYEEGTWVATLLNTTATITNTTGFYTKVGNLVTCSYYSLAIDNFAGGAAVLSGLPFVNDFLGAFTYAHGTAISTLCSGGYIPNNDSILRFTTLDTSATSAWTTGSDKYIVITATYMAQ